MRPVSFVICAAGEGSRMRIVSDATPKPLLKLKGKTLLQWSLESLELQESDQVIIVYRFENDLKTLTEELTKKYPKVIFDFLKISQLTKGQAETAFLAKNKILYSDLVIFNTDTYFRSFNLRHLIDTQKYDGLIPTANAPGSSWSFCKTKNDPPLYSVTEVTEKIRISDHCSVGYYYFKNKDVFFNLVEKSLNKKTDSTEMYVAPFYNLLIQNGLEIKCITCDEFKAMGTPEQTQFFWGISVEQMTSENKLS